MILKSNHRSLLKRLTFKPMSHKSFTHGDISSQLGFHFARYLEQMEQHGLVVGIEKQGDVVWHITNAGRAAIEGHKFKPSKDRIAAGTTVGTYDGAELRQTCLRPGAYDFMQCPSMIQGELKPYHGAI